MESWSYIPEERSYMFSDEMDFSLDAFMRSRKPLVDWENKSSCNFEKDGFNSEKEVVNKSMEFVDLGFPDFLHKSSFHGSKLLETTSSCDLDSNSSKRENSSTHVIAFDSSFGEEESESKHLSSLVDSKTHDSSLIDLKLGRLEDCKGATSGKDARGLPLTPTHLMTPAKRARTTSLPAHAPVCQVYGCNMDLSSSKDYHKRHKVCDVHSKTAKVIVNGIEQRFCQQCSRFHLLSAFDDGKRSCRRRLAGHNERRRKPQFDYMTSKEHKILQSYQGTKYLDSSLQNMPQFSFQDIFQSGILFPEKHDQISHSGHIKVEEKPICSPQLAASDALDHELSNCALSLLSAQSQNPSRHAAGIPLSSSLIYQEERDDQFSETPSRINSKEVIANRSATLSDAGHDPQVHGDGICQTSETLDIKYREHGTTTVDLFQLSSNLQRVEQQRNSVLVKWENEECSFPAV